MLSMYMSRDQFKVSRTKINNTKKLIKNEEFDKEFLIQQMM